MSRWWYTEDKETKRRTSDASFQKPRPRNAGEGGTTAQAEFTSWKFKCFVNAELTANENVAVSGNCDQLGYWSPNESVVLDKVDGEEEIRD